MPPSPHREDRTAALKAEGRGPTRECAQADSGGAWDSFLVSSLWQKPSGVGWPPAQLKRCAAQLPSLQLQPHERDAMFWGSFWERGYKGWTQPVPSPLLPGPHEGTVSLRTHDHQQEDKLHTRSEQLTRKHPGRTPPLDGLPGTSQDVGTIDPFLIKPGLINWISDPAPGDSDSWLWGWSRSLLP